MRRCPGGPPEPKAEEIAERLLALAGDLKPDDAAFVRGVAHSINGAAPVWPTAFRCFARTAVESYERSKAPASQPAVSEGGEDRG